jgi:hypothetical protein
LEATTASTLLSFSGQDLLHVALGVGRQPAVGVGLADDGDIARIDCRLQDFLLAATQEVGVRIGGPSP